MSEKKYLFEYRYDGDLYGFDVLAESPEEAKGKVSAMGLARYCGEIKLTIPVPGGNWLARFFGLSKT